MVAECHRPRRLPVGAVHHHWWELSWMTVSRLHHWSLDCPNVQLLAISRPCEFACHMNGASWDTGLAVSRDCHQSPSAAVGAPRERSEGKRKGRWIRNLELWKWAILSRQNLRSEDFSHILWRNFQGEEWGKKEFSDLEYGSLDRLKLDFFKQIWSDTTKVAKAQHNDS